MIFVEPLGSTKGSARAPHLSGLNPEMELARRVQKRLLPHASPVIDGLDVFAASSPALRVGGDFYDFILKQDRPFIFSVGDVTGKGLSAAMLAMTTRSVIRSAASFSTVCAPKVLMQRSNTDVYDDFTDAGMFVTAFIGHYSPGSNTMTIANAGHSPVIVCPFDGRATLLEADGTALGVLPFGTWENNTLRFQVGDVLVVATDGFNEARNMDGELFGYDRLLLLTENLACRSAREIVAGLYKAVRAFSCGLAQEDDQTVVVLKRMGHSHGDADGNGKRAATRHE